MMSSPWQPGSVRFDPSSDCIDLWRLDLSDSKLDARKDSLADAECRRADKFAFAADRNRFVRSRVALREILAAILNCRVEKIVFRYNPHDRPELAWPVVNDIQFNLSHAGDVALIAIAKGSRVGVDLDRVGRTTGWGPIARRSFSAMELTALFALPEIHQEAAFYRTWTQKEAYTKAIGDGYSYGFQKFSVAVDAKGSIGLLADDKNPQWVDAWTIVSIDAGPDLAAALAHDGPHTTEIRYWDYGDTH